MVEQEGREHLKDLLESHQAKRFVVGHTPLSGRIQARFEGSVFLIDTGMHSSFYRGGEASALEIRDETITAIYRDRTQVFP